MKNVSIPAWLGIAVPVLFYFWVLSRFSVNFPWNDDAIFMFYVHRRMLPELTWLNWWDDTLSKHVDHLVVIPRLLVAGLSKLTHELNFRTIVILGNLSLIGSFILLFREFARKAPPVWFFLPVGLILFSPVHWEDSLWPICVLQHNLLVFWVLVSLVCLQSSKTLGLPIALIAALFSILSSANGILIWLPGVAVLLAQRRYRDLVYWTLVLVIGLAAYMLDHEPSKASRVQESLSNPGQLIRYVLVFLGGNLSINFVTRALGLGAGIVGIWSIATVQNIQKRSFSIAWSLLTFLLLSAGVIALSRSWLGVSVVSRYQIYSTAAIVSAYLVLVDLLRPYAWRKAVIGTFTALIVLYAAVAWFSYWPRLTHRRDLLMAEVLNWRQNGFLLNVPSHQNVAIRRYYPQIMQCGMYRLPLDHYRRIEPKMLVRTRAPMPVLFHTEPSFEGLVLVSSVPQLDQNNSHSFLALVSSKTVVFMALHTVPNFKMQFLKTMQPFASGGTASVLIESLPPDCYEFGIYTNGIIHLTNQHFTKTELVKTIQNY